MRFSQRQGYASVRDALQVESMDEALRNGLWNAILDALPAQDSRYTWEYTGEKELFLAFWRDFFHKAIDQLPFEGWKARNELRVWFFAAKWYEVYDFVEFAFARFRDARQNRFQTTVAWALSQQMAGYRLISGLVVPITEPTELAAIDGALAGTLATPLRSINTHLTHALTLLSDRTSPDYRNSIKESISAVEAAARLLSGDPKSELAPALRALEVKAPLHGALRAGFLSLYGYTSDANGIRHSLTEDAQVDLTDAKFMLGACSSFCMYLLARGRDAGLIVS